MKLTPRPEVAAGMVRLEAEWFESNVGWFSGPSLTQAVAYRDSLRKHFGEGFDCDRCYRHFNEAIYPIDCSRELLDQICTDKLPESFGDFFDDEFSPLIPFREFDRAELYVLGANSD